MTDTEIVPLEDPTTTPAGLQQRLTEYTESRKIFMQWLFDYLEPGTDYMLIHRNLRGQPCPMKGQQHTGKCAKCGAKATLVKPGAEKIDGLLKLTPRFRKDAETWEMLGSPVGTIALVCELVNAAGQVVAEGRGVRNIEQDQGDANKCIKMCQKSGQIDATLRHAGLSEIFTLDLDDLAPQAAETVAAEAFPPPRRLATPGPMAGEGGDTRPSQSMSAPPARDAAPISSAQHRSLEAEITQYAAAMGGDPLVTRHWLKDKIGREFGKEHFPELTPRELTTVMGWLHKAWKKKA